MSARKREMSGKETERNETETKTPKQFSKLEIIFKQNDNVK